MANTNAAVYSCSSRAGCIRAEARGTTVYASATLLLGDIEGISASQHRRCSQETLQVFPLPKRTCYVRGHCAPRGGNFEVGRERELG